VTLNLAETSVAKSRPSIFYGANFYRLTSSTLTRYETYALLIELMFTVWTFRCSVWG